MQRRRRSLRACLLPRAEMVVSSWMRKSLALLLGSTLKSARRGVIDLLHVHGEVHLSRRVDTLLVTLVAGGAVLYIGAARVDGGEVTPSLPLDEVLRSNAKNHRFAENPSLVPFAHSSPSAFYTTLQSHPVLSACIHRTNPLAPTFMTSPYPCCRVLY